jgi:acetoacetate decarboxylase
MHGLKRAPGPGRTIIGRQSAHPSETDTLVGTLDYGPVRVATGTMGYKHPKRESPLSSADGRHLYACTDVH